MKKIYSKEIEGEIYEDIYNKETRNHLVEDDEINGAEAGFMEGYENA